jgi:hypothetical protein
MADEGEDDATEILGRNDTVATATELDATLPHTYAKPLTESATATQLLPAQKRKWQSYRWIAAALSCVLLATIVYYFVKPQPPTSIPEPSSVDAYHSALAVAESAVDKGEIQALPALLLSHWRKQPDNVGIRNLLRDATHYRDMLYLLQESRLMDLAEERRTHALHSSLLEEAARQNIDKALPPTALLQQWSDARDAWRVGDLVTAISSVKQLATDSSHPQARAMLQHYSQIVEDYETLSVLKNNPDYTQKLLSFYLGLDPLDDHFFWARLEKDFQRATAQPTASLSQMLQRGADLWSHYHSQGGIDGEMRQAPMAGNAFPQRAAQLSEASGLLRKVASQRPLPEQAGERAERFPALLDEEIRAQRERLETLLRFNDEDLLTSRLDMLPHSVATSRR